jgi:hypothetical protein
MKTDPDLRQYRIAIVIPDDPRTVLRLRFHDFLREITGYPVDVIFEELSTDS